MNEMQVIHAHSVARHVREHAELLVSRMRGIERQYYKDDLIKIQPEAIANLIKTEVELATKEINQVLADMLPDLDGKVDDGSTKDDITPGS